MISRFVADYFWEYKVLSVLHLLLSFFLLVYCIILSRKSKYKFIQIDYVFCVFLILISFIYLLNPIADSLIELSKFISYFLIYFIGRMVSVDFFSSYKILGVFSFIGLLFFLAMAFFGQGYQMWGRVNTFTGGYFFKTDLAIASLIFLVFVFATLKSRLILFASFLVAFYLIFLSNTRIALPLVLVIPVFLFFSLNKNNFTLSLSGSFYLIFASVVGVLLLSVFNMSGVLGFDFSDPLSVSNTQGRSVIWEAILLAYSEGSLFNKLFGFGLTADVVATTKYSSALSLEGVRAHNSFLYLLLCVGIFGSFLFYLLVYLLITKAQSLFKNDDVRLKIIPSISCSFIIMFFWLSLTTEVIIRPQLMILLFFFSGLHVQSYLNVIAHGRRQL